MKKDKSVSNEDIFSTLANLNEAVGNRFDKVDRKLIDIDSRIGYITQVSRLQNK